MSVTTAVLVGLGIAAMRMWMQRHESQRLVLALPPRSERPALPAPPAEARPRVHRRLGAAQEGEFIIVTGSIQGSTGSLVAPLSGTTCVAYAAVARSVHRDVDVPLSVDLDERQVAPMVIAVDDGTVALEGDCRLRLRLAPVAAEDAERTRAFLLRRQLQHFLPSTEFMEGVLQIGDRVWVSGVLVHERAGEHGYREQPISMRLVGRPGRPLSIGRARRAP